MRDLFSSLYVLAANRDATIADYCHRDNGAVVWSPIFIRDAFVDDTSLASFLNKLNEINTRDSPNAVIWNLNSKGVFTVKSYYFKLLSPSPQPFKLILLGGFLGKLFGKI